MSEDLPIYIRLSPAASRNAVGKWFRDEKDRSVLKVSVTAAPEKGRANEALLTLLSEYWDIQKHRLTLAKGLTDRNKTLIINRISKEEKVRVMEGI